VAWGNRVKNIQASGFDAVVHVLIHVDDSSLFIGIYWGMGAGLASVPKDPDLVLNLQLFLRWKRPGTVLINT
jgi:hypothetical protein